MEFKHAVSRRRFVGGLAAALGYVSAGTGLDVFAQGAAGQGRPGGAPRPQQTAADYDALAKLAPGSTRAATATRMPGFSRRSPNTTA